MHHLLQIRIGHWAIACIFLLSLGSTAGAQSAEEQAKANGRIYLYQGADRDQKLINAAKQEGTVSIYTSMQLPDSSALTQAFEKKYGIKTTLWRASGEKVVQRALVEARAARHDVDVFETDGSQIEILYREKQLAPFFSPSFKDIPPAVFPPHKHYAPTRLSLYVLAYNTKLIAPHEVPNSYADLLNPKWSGRLGVEGADVAWFAAVTKAMGEEQGLAYFRRLAAMNVAVRNGHTLIAELAAAGEIPIVLDAHIQGVERLKKRGAPIEWKALPPAFGQPSAVALAERAPHPHAALLFADFILSKEGQEIIKARNRVPVSSAVDSPLNKFKYQLIDPVIVLDEWDKWSKLWSQLFLGGKEVKKEAD
ncbi:MAG: extracellular solute-binding protein [Burkholderiales bacterium]|nr:extracellular solute-binding protein [Burkholderiales bacterium]